MPNETEARIAKLDAAMMGGFKLPPMRYSHVMEIVLLMHKAGRSDLTSAAHRLIPIDRNLPATETLEQARKRSEH